MGHCTCTIDPLVSTGHSDTIQPTTWWPTMMATDTTFTHKSMDTMKIQEMKQSQKLEVWLQL